MRQSAAVLLLVIALLVARPVPSHASGWHGGAGWHGGWHGAVVVGGPWWGPVYPYPYAYPYPYWYYPPYYPYPPAAAQEPSVYVQQPRAPAQTYWYYCASAKKYYPDVPKCREAWIKVPPTPE
jgi:hypothetical protein